MDKYMHDMNTTIKNTKNRIIEVHTMSVDDFNSRYPANSEITMSPIPKGHVARLASLRLLD